MVKGLSFFSLFTDYLIEEELVLWIPRKIKRGTSVSYAKMVYDVCVATSPLTPHKWYSGIDSTNNLTIKYIPYLCFTVTYRTNKLGHYQNDKYSKTQKENHDLIQSLREKGLGYRKISKLLNDKGIKTSKGNTWTNSKVFSVLKKYKEREERLKLINKEYEPVWGKMEIKFQRN